MYRVNRRLLVFGLTLALSLTALELAFGHDEDAMWIAIDAVGNPANGISLDVSYENDLLDRLARAADDYIELLEPDESVVYPVFIHESEKFRRMADRIDKRDEARAEWIKVYKEWLETQ